MTKNREWENWDVGKVAQIIDGQWYTREAKWRRFVADDIKECFGENASLVDVGCGSGLMCQALLGCNAIDINSGGDITNNLLDIARKRIPQAKFTKMDIFDLPFENKSQPNVFCTQVLQHLPGYAPALKELMRVTSNKLYILTWFVGDKGDEIIFKQFKGYENQWFYSNMYSLSNFVDHIKTVYKDEIQDVRVKHLDKARHFSICVEMKNNATK
jgi:ubiquinone/menaquinone biosynthesis C-methylase UbiE